jgi:deoxyribodipyrimidine photolyase-related protein
MYWLEMPGLRAGTRLSIRPLPEFYWTEVKLDMRCMADSVRSTHEKNVPMLTIQRLDGVGQFR